MFYTLHLSQKPPDVYMVKYFLGFSSHCTEQQTFPFTNTSYINLRTYLRKMSDICVRFDRTWNVLANFMESLKWNVTRILPVVVALLRAEKRTDIEEGAVVIRFANVLKFNGNFKW